MRDTSCSKPVLRPAFSLASFPWVLRGAGGILALSVLAWSPASRAQTPPPAEPAPAAAPEAAPAAEPAPTINVSQPPTIDLAVPPPPPPVERSYRQHEGFYTRVNVGLGSMLSATVDPEGPGEVETGGLTLNYDLLIGGSPAAGFSIGGGVLGGFQMSGDWEVNGAEVDGGDLMTLIVGPFADGYPLSTGGLHFGGLVGLAYAAVDAPGPGDGQDAIGFGGAFWAGHDIWVAPEWSVGGSLRLDALRATASDPDVTVTEVGLTLSFSVLYN